MKRFVITGFTVNNVARFQMFQIRKQNIMGDVVVTGQNGTGKTMLKSAVQWTLSQNRRQYEDLIPYNSDKMPNVEVELFDGETYTTFRCELVSVPKVSKPQSVSMNCYMNGLPVKAKDIEEFFKSYCPHYEILMEPEKFFKLKDEERRKILVENFADISDEEILSLEEFAELDTKGMTLEKYGEVMKANIKRIKSERLTIPALIRELTSQVTEVADDRSSVEVEIVELETKLHNVLVELSAKQEVLKKVNEPLEKIQELNRELWRLRSDREVLKDRISATDRQIEKLREKWRLTAEKCPTCGQKIQAEKVQTIRNKINVEGCELAKKINEDRKTLMQVEQWIEEMSRELAKKQVENKDNHFDYEEFNEVVRQREELREGIMKQKNHVKEITRQVELNAKNERRVEELIRREKALGRELVESEHQLGLLEKFVQKKMELVTESINRQFEHVKFKMYETLKNGSVRNICEATLNGVPYSNLSKGEKLKAALDVLNTMQKYYGVMFPVMIDDAESYTTNSLIEVENQKFLFKVVEGSELQIKVEPYQNEEEKNCDLDITVNLERLTPTEADELLKALDNVKTGIGQRYLDLEDVDEAGLIVEVTGRVTVSSYDEAIEILKSYDVDYKEK